MHDLLVLVAEDEPAIQELIKEGLTEGGFRVATAGSGEEAVALLESAAADYKALVTDIGLRGKIDGWDVAKRARVPSSTSRARQVMNGPRGAFRTACWSKSVVREERRFQAGAS